MLIYFKSYQRFLLKASLPVITSLVTNMSSNIRMLRSRFFVKSEPKTSNADDSQSTPKTNKYLKLNNVKQEISPSTKTKKKGIIKTETEIPVTVKEEVESNGDHSPLTTNLNCKAEPPKASKKNISPRKRKQIKTESVSVKPEKVIKLKSEKTSTQDMEDIGWEPENWREVLDNILKMRKLHIAPVDSLGCEECPEKGVLPEVFRYQTLISVMLSSQTRDEVTFAATQRLIGHGLTVDSILQTSDEKISELIYPAGFWKSKVKYIRNTTQILKDQYGGDIPRTFKDLCKLPGVGPKMANIVMSVGWNDTVGIAVDTHVHRISNRLGWVPKPTKDPEQTRKALEKWLPKSLWKDASLDLVGFGQTICKPIKPKCQDCLNCDLCPSSTNKSK